jgi:hypothetical protein
VKLGSSGAKLKAFRATIIKQNFKALATYFFAAVEVHIALVCPNK